MRQLSHFIILAALAVYTLSMPSNADSLKDQLKETTKKINDLRMQALILRQKIYRRIDIEKNKALLNQEQIEIIKEEQELQNLETQLQNLPSDQQKTQQKSPVEREILAKDDYLKKLQEIFETRMKILKDSKLSVSDIAARMGALKKDLIQRVQEVQKGNFPSLADIPLPFDKNSKDMLEQVERAKMIALEKWYGMMKDKDGRPLLTMGDQLNLIICFATLKARVTQAFKNKEKLNTDIPDTCDSLSTLYGFKNGGCFYTILQNVKEIRNLQEEISKINDFGEKMTKQTELTIKQAAAIHDAKTLCFDNSSLKNKNPKCYEFFQKQFGRFANFSTLLLDADVIKQEVEDFMGPKNMKEFVDSCK